MPSFPFYKMHGAGNDFIFVPRTFSHKEMSNLALRLCRRTRGIGADGLVFLEQGNPAFRWHFYNADGSRGEMCGNAARCAFALAFFLGWTDKQENLLETDSGPVHGQVHSPLTLTGENEWLADISVTLPLPHSLRMDNTSLIHNVPIQYHTVWVGVPHAVCLVESRQKLESLDVQVVGKALRYHADLQPDGANVNFVWVESPQCLHIRTYERGVEAETEACGTGSAASAFVCRHAGLTEQSVSVIPKSKETLGINLKKNTLFLSGPAALVFHGEYGD